MQRYSWDQFFNAAFDYSVKIKHKCSVSFDKVAGFRNFYKFFVHIAHNSKQMGDK